LKKNKILTKKQGQKLEIRRIRTKLEASTTKKTNLYFLGQERDKKTKKVD
jgi:hypothetical protein